jgi:hypothetical protein
VLCPFEYSEVVCASRTPELRFTTAELDFLPVMTWTGDTLIVGVQLEPAAGQSRWGVAATVDASAEVETLWELPPENSPTLLLSAPDGLFVFAQARSSNVTGGLFRLHPDGSHERLLETPSSGLRYDPAQPLVFAEGMIYGHLSDGSGPHHNKPARISATGGALEVFDFTATIHEVVDGSLVGIDRNFGAPPCEHGADCNPPLVSLALLRHDLAASETTTIDPAICITANPGYEPSRYMTRPVERVGVHANGIVVNDGALVEIGFDGSHRVVAALEDYISGATLHDGSIYFVATHDSEPGIIEFRALRRVPLQGGPVEELVRFPGNDGVEIGTFDDEHIYISHITEDGRDLLRLAL